jgi:hypothetical protein
MKVIIRKIGLGAAVLMLLACPGGWDIAQAQEKGKAGFKQDLRTPKLLQEGKDQQCPPGSATIYISGRRVCAQCPPDYTAVDEGGKVTCLRSKIRPRMRVPDGYQPKFKALNSKGGCTMPFKLAELPGKKACVKCKPGYRYHPYYSQGRCLICKKGESLNEIGGKIMCLSCPVNARMVGYYGRVGADCVCDGGQVFGWSDMGYGCYPMPAK